MADDDADDQLMTGEAFRECGLCEKLHCVDNGEQLLDYLHGRGAFQDPASHPTPDLILLDLNMPRKDGREALIEIKSDPALRNIPVIIWTTSRAEEDIARSLRDGSNGYITKPSSIAAMIEIVQGLGRDWLVETARQPSNGSAS